MKSEMQKGFDAQRAAGINVDWFTWQIAWADARSAAGASEGQAQPISDFMMDLVDRLGSEADAVDPRAWKHLLVYAPKEGSRQTTVISELKQVTQTPDVSYEHLFALAKMCGLIGPYRIKEVNDRIIGYARVVLNDNAVQEAFVRANEHVLSAEIAALRERIAGIEKDARRNAELIEAALRAAKRFIENGMELGYIRMQTVDHDPANYTLPTVCDALAAIAKERQ